MQSMYQNAIYKETRTISSHVRRTTRQTTAVAWMRMSPQVDAMWNDDRQTQTDPN